MKNLFLTLSVLLLLTACESRPQTTKEEMPAVAEVNETKILSKYSDKLQKIFLNDKGIIRGINLGDNIANVEAEIDTTQIEIKPEEGKIKFVTNLNNYEDADIIFFFDKNEKIISIGIDPYLNTQPSVDSLSKEMIQYFTEKYGKIFVKEGKKNTGKAKNLKIVIEDVSIKTVPGLQIRISKD